MAKRLLTAKFIDSIKAKDTRQYVSDTGAKTDGNGQLQLAIDPSGRRSWVYRYSLNGSTDRLKMGLFGDGEGCLTLEQARGRAGVLAGIHEQHGDVRGFLEAQERERQAEERAKEAAKAAANSHTLQRLLDLYVNRLAEAGKGAWRDVRNLFKNHINSTSYATWPAAKLTPEDIADLIRPLASKKKLRTADKLRSYLHTAYKTAIRAKTDFSIPQEWKAFGISVNPVADVAVHGKGQRIERTLNDAELAAFLKRLRKLDSVVREPLLLSILLAGQRPTQVLRLRAADVDLDAGTVLLFDPKGKRKTARPHLLPLITLKDADSKEVPCEARQIIERLLLQRGARIAKAKEEERVLREPNLLFAPTDRPTDATSLSGAVGDIAKAMLAADPVEATGSFAMRDLRRSAETKLAQLAVSKEVRAHLLSHGIFGIQDASYNRYEFWPEKTAALEAWTKELARIESGKPQASNVANFPPKRKAAR